MRRILRRLAVTALGVQLAVLALAALAPGAAQAQCDTCGDAVAAFTATPTSGNAPLPVSFDATTSQGRAFTWDFGDGSSGSGMTASHTFNQPGTYQVTLTVDNTNGSDSVTHAVTAFGPPTGAVSPGSLAFGPQAVRSISGSQSVTVQNNGPGPMTINGASIAGDFNAFAPWPNGCTHGMVLANGATCVLQVSFQPADYGTRTGTLSVQADAGNAPLNVPLTGTGIGSAVQTNVARVDFGTVPIGYMVQKPVVVTNVGNAPWTQYNQLNQPGVAFAFDMSACKDLAPGASCTALFGVNLPDNSSWFSSVQLLDSRGWQPQIGLSATGGRSSIAVSPQALGFGNVVLGKSKQKTLTITSTGNAPVYQLSIGGPSAAPFSVVSNSCPQTLAAGASCQVVVKATPFELGPYGDALTIDYATAAGQVRVPLSETGVPPITISADTGGLAFGSQYVGTASAASRITFTANDGPVTVSGISIKGANAAAFKLVANTCAGVTIPSGGHCTADVRFAPLNPGAMSANVVVVGNASNTPFGVPLSGTGTPNADLAVSASATPDPVVSGSLLTYQLVVHNNGPTVSNGIVLTDTPGAAARFSSVTGASCSHPPVGSSGAVICKVASLAKGATVAMTLVERVTGGAGTLADTASVTSNTHDPQTANNSVAISTQVS